MKIKLWCATHDIQSFEEEIFELEDYGFTEEEIVEMSKDTEKDLDKIAEEFMWETKQPEYGYEILDDKQKEFNKIENDINQISEM